MKIDINTNNGVLTVSLEGRLDTTTAPELEAALADNLNSTTELTFNCDGLVYISSAGLRVLLSAHKKMKGAMKLTGVCELVMEVLEMTGFSDIFVIE